MGQAEGSSRKTSQWVMLYSIHSRQTSVAGAEGVRWKQMELEWERPRGARSLAMVVG